MTTDNRTNEQIGREAIYDMGNLDISNIASQCSGAVVAALEAAGRLVAAQGAAPQAGRRPKRLLNQLNRIADALEEYEFDGVAADAPAWMRKAAEYIESERQWRAPVLPSSGVDEDALAEVIGSLGWGYMVDGPSVSEIARAVAVWLKGQGNAARE